MDLPYKLIDWIDNKNNYYIYSFVAPNKIYSIKSMPKQINWDGLSKNPNAIEWLKAFPEKTNLYFLYYNLNPNVIDLMDFDIHCWFDKIFYRVDAIDVIKPWIFLLQYHNNIIMNYHNNINMRVYWDVLSLDPNAIDLLRKHPNKINWDALSLNPNGIKLLREHPNNIHWGALSLNPNGMELLRENPNKINWGALSLNPNAMELLRENPNKINWIHLSANPSAMDLLLANPNKINWEYLSANTNPSAIELLRANPNKINWEKLSANPSIFQLDYQKMRETKREINEAIIAAAWHPNRIAKQLVINSEEVNEFLFE